MPARLRAFLTSGLSDLVAALDGRLAALGSGAEAAAAEMAGARRIVEDQSKRLGSAIAEMRLALDRAGEQAGERAGELRTLFGELAAAERADHARLQSEIAHLRSAGERMEREIVALRSLVGGQEDRIQRRVRASLASVVNLISLLPRLDIEGVLPPFPHQGWEISGELAAYLFFLVRRHAPRLILELGSGSSTVLFAAAARANGIGRVVSVEHDPEHFARTAQFLAQAGLSDWVDLIEAPLVEQRFGTLDVQWYDLATVLAALPGKIGLLFVDGPPGRLQPLSRFPALPALLPHLAAEAVVLVDDGLREDEARMIELWRDLGIPFKSEALAFLPRSPMLLTIAPGEHPVAELHRLKASRSDLAAAAGGRRGAERRNSAL